jgi:hypothetical protein
MYPNATYTYFQDVSQKIKKFGNLMKLGSSVIACDIQSGVIVFLKCSWPSASWAKLKLLKSPDIVLRTKTDKYIF